MADLEGKKGLIFGIANAHSIAYGCAKALRAQGARLAVTYRNAKAEPYIRPLALDLGCDEILPCDVEEPGAMEAVFHRLNDRWGGLDFVLHSIAFAPKADLHGRVVDCSKEGFAQAMDISVHSFIRAAHLAEPMMGAGGCLLSLTNYGVERVDDAYNLMGPVKAALEAASRYMATELGPKGIRVNTFSSGPLKTRAASGIAHFDDLMDQAAASVPEHHQVDLDDVGALVAFLVSDKGRSITGDRIYVDAGYHIVD